MNKAFGDLLRVVSQRNNFIEIVFPYQISNQCCSLSIHIDILSLKKDIKKRIPPRIYRYHPPCNELMISGMVLKHL